MNFRFLSAFTLLGFLGIASCQRSRTLDSPRPIQTRTDGILELRLMSFNVRYENATDSGTRSWPQRIIGAVKMIRRQQPDLLGVQEAQHGQVADLWASLPRYEFYGLGRDDGERAGEYSGIFYDRDRFQADATEQGVFWLSDQPETPGSRTWGNEIPRIATWLHLIDRATGRGFYIFNTHWDHKNQASREKSALLISQRIDARKHQDEPVVLMGDFNSTETNPGMIYLTGKQISIAGKKHQWPHGLVDSFQTLHANEKKRRTLHFWSDRRDGALKVDHILVSQGAKIDSAEIVSGDKPMVSDHFPVAAHVRFPPKN